MKKIDMIKSKLLRQKKSKLNKQLKCLTVIQEINNLSINGTIKDVRIMVSQLWIVGDNGFKKSIQKIKGTEKFQFNINLESLLKELDNGIMRYNLYILASLPYKYIENVNKDNILERRDGAFFKALIPLGKFKSTIIKDIKTLKDPNSSLQLFITDKGFVSLIRSNETPQNVKTYITSIKVYKTTFSIKGRINIGNNLLESSVVEIYERESGKKKNVTLSTHFLKKESIKTHGNMIYSYKISLALKDIMFKGFKEQGIYDIYIILNLKGIDEPLRVRVGKPKLIARYLMNNGYLRDGKSVYSFTPYFTFKAKNISITVEKYDSDVFLYMKRVLRWAWLLRPLYYNKNIWLIGERVYKAQDTGFCFFKYMRENHSSMNVYYVIDQQSSEFKKVKPLGNVLIYKSKKHILYTLMATKIIGSHHPNYLYPMQTKRFKKAVKGNKVFLQHGIMGTKNMVDNYGKHAEAFESDLFLVSSDFEKSLVMNDLGYSSLEVAITGLSRFDSLLENDVKPKKQLLIIPTWRDWIVTECQFLESDYFKRWLGLIKDKTLLHYAECYEFSIVFCLHPNMQKYTPLFDNEKVKVISQGDINVQQLMKESQIMITDYSSVGFDFSFLQRPVLYYQFDKSDFFGKRESHINIEGDLPGRIVENLNDLLSLVKYYSGNNYQVENEIITRSNKFLKYRDRYSNERIYNAINERKNKRKFI